MKYRVRLNSGRVVGPFKKEQVAELFFKGHINGTEKFQEFPIGDWCEPKELPELYSYLIKTIEENKQTINQDFDKTTVNLIVSKDKKDNTKDPKAKVAAQLNEFKSDDEEDDDKEFYEELEKNYNQSKSPNNSKIIRVGDLDSEEEIKEEPVEEVQEEELEEFDENKTVLRRDVKVVDVDKTVVTADTKKFLEEIQKKKEEEEKKSKLKETKEELVAVPLAEDKTQMFNLEELSQELKEIVLDAEKELEAKENKNLPKVEKKVEKVEKEAPKKKGMRPIIALIFALLIGYLLMPSEEDKIVKTIVPVYATFKFPVSNDYINDAVANEELAKAVEQYGRGTYISKLKAAKHLQASLTHKFKNNKALGLLIRVYSELLPNAKDKKRAQNSLFKLIEVGQSKQLTDINVAIGTAKFYSYYGKKSTALNILKNYLRVGQPTMGLFVDYLDLLIDAGEIDEAKKVFDKIKNFENIPFRGYLAMARYLTVDEMHDESKKILIQASKKYAQSVELLIAYANQLIIEQDIANLKNTLIAIQALEAEKSPYFYSQYLEGMGILSAFIGQNNIAVGFFKKALSFHNSVELRSKLATLEIGGSEAVKTLILESKVVELIRKSKIEVKNRNWEEAFKLAIDASDLIETYVPAKLLLASIQTERGYFNSAIETLERLYNEFPVDEEVNYQLVDTYIAARKFPLAQKQINTISSTSVAKSYKYNAMLAHYFDGLDNLFTAASWYKKTIRENPLSDVELYRFAKMLMRHNQLNDAKKIITMAIKFDPMNLDYRMIYADLVFEFDGVNSALSYIRELLIDYPDNPKLLAKIAIFYHQSGKLADFERYKNIIEKMDVIDSTFYAYLIDSAALDENNEQVVKYSVEYIRLNPGSLERRMILGKYLIEKRVFGDAEKVFMGVSDRLPTYPKLNYYLAKIKMLKKDYDEAFKYADLEIKYNESAEFGYYIKGEIFIRVEKYQEATKMFEYAIARNGKSFESLIGLAWIKAKQAYYDESKDLYLRALQEEPSNPKGHRDLGYVYKSMGQSKLAIDSFTVYLKLLPTASDKKKIQSEISQLR